ncbi:MAG: hypothetical protein Q8L55_16155 [Phycisphaerales bacterium]|nr:hypothetical protein [Phycisphaerales bacterium]
MRTPPRAKTFIRLWLGLMVLLVGIVFVVPQFAWSLGPAAIWIALSPAPFILIGVVVVYRWYCNYARQYNGEICRRCNYPLQGLPAPGICPECGRAYGPDRDRSVWQRYL